MTRSRTPASLGSLTGRAVLALLLMVSFYLLILTLIGCIVWTGLWLLEARMASFDSDIPGELFTVIGIAAGGLAWSLLPQIDEFTPPGPELTAADHPRLFEVLKQVTQDMRRPMPREVYLLPGVEVWIAVRGGAMGIGSRRVMGIGLLALQRLTTVQLRAVIAHQLGHARRGGPTLGSWIYRTRAIMRRTVLSLRDDPWAVHFAFEWYAQAFLRLTKTIALHQELFADSLAATTYGRAALVEAIEQLERSGAVQQAYWDAEVMPVVLKRMRPPIAEGFERWMNDERTDNEIVTALARAQPPPPEVAHLSVQERIDALDGLPKARARAHADDARAVGLLDDVSAIEGALVKHMRAAFGHREYEAVAWEEIESRALVRRYRRIADKNAGLLRGVTVADIPERLPARSADLGYESVIEGQTDEDIDRYEAAIIVRMLDDGWTLEVTDDGRALVRDELRFWPGPWLEGLWDGTANAASWREECERVGIAEMGLEATAVDGAPKRVKKSIRGRRPGRRRRSG